MLAVTGCNLLCCDSYVIYVLRACVVGACVTVRV
jgi:hypothetical protein